jgi:hypothetical protein
MWGVLGRIRVAVALSVVATGLFAGPASAQPVWRINSVANTTVAPGGTFNYLVEIANVGDSDANPSGHPITFTATMPSGVSATDFGDFAATFHGWNCSATTFGVSGGTVTCTNATDIFRTAQDSNGLNYDIVRIGATTDAATPSGTVRAASFRVTGATAALATTVDPTTVTDAPPHFGVDAFDGQVTSDVAGDPATQAGGHPYEASTSIDFDTMTNPAPLIGDLWPVQPAKDIVVDLPPGFVGNPTTVAQCSLADLSNSAGIEALPLCPESSQVGTTTVRLNTGGSASEIYGPLPVFNLVPAPNAPASFGFNIAGTVVTLDATLRSFSDYGLTAHVRYVPEGLAIAGTSLTLWGVPSDSSHDAERACRGQDAPWLGGPSCLSQASKKAFLRNPTACTATGVGLLTGLHIDAWNAPGRVDANGAPDLNDPNWQSSSFVSHLLPAYPSPPSAWGAPQGPTGCDKVPFDPTLEASPTSPPVAGEPAGFAFDLSMPQSDDPNAIDEGDIKKVVVSFPQGMRVSPSAADGLAGCSPAQIGLHSTADPTCPDASKIGSLTIKTPLLNEPLTGSVYLATPNDNPFGSLVAVYLVAKGPGDVIVKLAGKSELDPNTGQLTVTVDNNPQAPISSLHLELHDGPRAPLVAPSACGTYTTHTELTSWSGKVADSDSSFTVSGDGAGGPCAPASQFAPGFTAGTSNPVAGAESPLLVRLTRTDRDQELSGLTVYTPTGLTGRIANVPLCPENLAVSGACDASSQIGTATVGAGAGPDPFYIQAGRVYLTGPYKGAPYGLDVVVPAVAGPFDLGNVVVRSKIDVDPHTAQLSVATDPLPTILQGIPLDVRDIRVAIDRPHFMLNPTSCAEKHVLGTVVSTAGASAQVSSRFQVGNCGDLALTPKLTLTVGARGRTKNGVSTPLSAKLTQPPGQSNLRAVKVTLPGTLNALLPVVNRACSLADYDAGHCTSKARVGSAVAVTPILSTPLRGSAYFVKNPARVLPDLMVALRGAVSIDLTGKVSIPGGKRLATNFDTIPDEPITSFTLNLVAGKNGPVGVVSNLCTAKAKKVPATLGIRGQNGRVLNINQPVRILGCPKPHKPAKRKRHG